MNAIDDGEWKDKLGIMGFGIYDNRNISAKILQYAEVNKKDSKKCFKAVRRVDKLPPDWDNWKKDGFCIRGDNLETVGKGDSGGPVIWTTPDQKKTFLGCCHDSFPELHNQSRYLDFGYHNPPKP